MIINKDRLKEIILKNRNGFTIDKNLNFVNKKNGFVVGLTNNKEKNIDILINKAIENYNTLKHLSRYKLYFGGWCDNNTFFLDISLIIPEQKQKENKTLALSLAKIQNQQAIFNFKTMECINIK